MVSRIQRETAQSIRSGFYLESFFYLGLSLVLLGIFSYRILHSRFLSIFAPPLGTLAECKTPFWWWDREHRRRW